MEIHRELCAIYGTKAISERNVTHGVECSKVGKYMFMMKSDVVGQPSVVSDDLVQSVDQKIHERQHFTISELLCKFPQISCNVLYNVLYKITTVRPGYHKFCTR
jgi:hypothetical protein